MSPPLPPPIDLLLAENLHEARDSTLDSNQPYLPVLRQDACTFEPAIFERVVLNLLQNPNITSSHLFRADTLYDSQGQGDNAGGGGDDDAALPGAEGQARSRLASDAWPADSFAGFRVEKTLIRRLVPRNPQLDRPLEQTCHFLRSDGPEGEGGAEGPRCRTLVVCIPHASTPEAMPWYHPNVQALAYAYDWRPQQWPAPASTGNSRAPRDAAAGPSSSSGGDGSGTLTLHYKLFEGHQPGGEGAPLGRRLQRTALHLVKTLSRHGEGQRAGYAKKFHHDLLLAQARVQDRYAELKQRHARRLCGAWVEVTEPSKHVFEDLAIAAFLIELWRDMYGPGQGRTGDGHDGVRGATGELANSELAMKADAKGGKVPRFPGFVDIGCGNGVLTEVLLAEGYEGWGFDARRRKTWAVLSPKAKARLREMILIPQPLLSQEAVRLPGSDAPIPGKQIEGAPRSLISRARSALSSVMSSSSSDGPNDTAVPTTPVAATDPTQVLSAMDQDRWHNGLFARGTFIVSNHADELTAWTPMLASLSGSPFLAIPCCSHNLSGARFRAPSLYTGFTADAAAPGYFDKQKMAAAAAGRKHIAIHVPLSSEGEHGEGGDNNDAYGEGGDSAKGGERHGQGQDGSAAAETGDLKALSPKNRAKQPSAYSSLCDWVAHLADEVGYEVEKEMLRIPSTRNVGIVCRAWAGKRRLSGSDSDVDDDHRGFAGDAQTIPSHRWATVMEIVHRERPDGKAWVERARSLMSGKDTGQTVHVSEACP